MNIGKLKAIRHVKKTSNRENNHHVIRVNSHGNFYVKHNGIDVPVHVSNHSYKEYNYLYALPSNPNQDDWKQHVVGKWASKANITFKSWSLLRPDLQVKGNIEEVSKIKGHYVFKPTIEEINRAGDKWFRHTNLKNIKDCLK